MRKLFFAMCFIIFTTSVSTVRSAQTGIANIEEAYYIGNQIKVNKMDNNTELDVNKPIENPVLLKLLNEMETLRDEAQKDNLMEEIVKEITLNSHFLSIFQYDDEELEKKTDGQVYFKQGSKLSFVSFSNADNQIFFPAFTDWNELRKGEMYKNGNVKTFILSFDDYYSLVKDSNAGVVINPFSHNIKFSNEDIKQMKQIKEIVQKGHSEIVIEKETEVFIDEPNEYPTNMVNAIINYSKNIKEINAIWLKLMTKGEEQSYLLVVDFKGDKQSIFAGIANVARPFLPNDIYVDMVPYNTSFGKSVAEGRPFYKRKRKLFPFL